MARMPLDMVETLMAAWNSKARENMQLHYVKFCSGVDYETAVRAQTKDLTEPLTYDQCQSLSWAYESQGRYEEAIPLASLGRKRIMAKLIDARDREDVEFCSCKIMPVETEKVWSTRHDDWVSVMTCPSCQEINLTPEQLKPELVKAYNNWVALNTPKQNATG